MTVSRLINLFSSCTKPVEVKEVRDQIVEWGYHDGITIAPFDGPPERLLGTILHYDVPLPYGTIKEYCVIRYNKNLPVPLQRLVCVKELVHSMDGVALRISTKVQLNSLLEEILHDPNAPHSTWPPAFFEDVAIYQALAILGSEDEREVLFDKYNRQEVSLNDVAERFVIPIEYAGYLMVPNWKSFRQNMILHS